MTKQKPAQNVTFYAMIMTPLSFVNLPIGVALPSFYAENTAATLAGIGLVIMYARFFDAATDPLIGYLSDRTSTRFGSRKPWILAGTFITAIALAFLFNPPAQSGVAYFALWSFAFYLGQTCVEIPLKAWGVELSRDAQERSRISSMATMFTIVGSLIFWLTPILLYKVTGTTAITGSTFTTISWLFAAVLPLVVFLAVRFVPRGERLASGQSNLLGAFAAIAKNAPARYFYAAQGLWLIGNGVFMAVIYIFMSQYLKIEAYFAFIMIAYFVVQVIAVPIWLRLIYRFGKRRCWAASWILHPLASCAVLFIPPGPDAFAPALILVVFTASLAAGALTMPMAVLGDVIDYDTLKTGVNRSANYFAFSNILTKSGIALGYGVALPLLAAFGFEWGQPVEGLAKTGLFIVYLGVPGVFSTLAGLMVLNFPLHEQRHAIVARRLEARSARMLRDAAIVSAATGEARTA